MEKPSWILYGGTFPPRECGIATFTRDLTNALDKKFSNLIKSKILAMNRNGINIYNYPKDVIFQINDDDMHDYIDTAKKINQQRNIKLVNIQHEFGIFGGVCGDNLIAFLEIVEKPVVLTFHSVLPAPDERRKKVVQSIAEKVKCIVVMTKTAVDILRNIYEVKTDIELIPHGIPTVSFSSSKKHKRSLGYENKIILSSFGLINSGKGYEYVVEALPAVIKKFPNLLYLIVGETHPVVREQEGERYRNFLKDKVKKLGLEKNVKFYNKYLKLSEIIKYLQATDIYISSSLDPNQITSGTLVYAMGCGRAVISTPFLHANDIVTEERGLLVKFKDTKSYRNAIIKILSDKKLKRNMEISAYAYTRHMTWPNVALAYKKIYDRCIQYKGYETKLPRFKLNHLIRLTDDFGVIQFAKNVRPDPNSGYMLDDNARAMIVCCKAYKENKDEHNLELIKIYLKFIEYVQQSDGRLFDFVHLNKKIDKKSWSEDAHGRAVWSLGCLVMAKSIPSNLRIRAERILKKAIKPIIKIKSPRAVAFIILGLYFYHKAKPSINVNGKIKGLADYLVLLYNECSSDEWKWFEGYLTYSNSKLPEALYYAYLATKNKKYLNVANDSLNFLMSVTFEKDIFVPVGQNGWYYKNGKKAYFDQQPIDTASMVQTLMLAYDVTKQNKFKKKAMDAFQWFLGRNSLNQVVYNELSGGCHDGVGENSINLNQGAESTISYLMARLHVSD